MKLTIVVCKLFWTNLENFPWQRINFLPFDKTLDWFKFEVFVDDKINVSKNLKFILENIVEKGGNTGYQHFLLFLLCFQKAFSHGCLKLVKG